MFIDFLLDPDSLSATNLKSSTFDNPLGIGHPALKYRNDADKQWSILEDGDFKVPVAPDDNVFITVSSASAVIKYVMAPVRFLPAYWMPAGNDKEQVDCTKDLLSSTNAPIQRPRFGVDHPGGGYTLSYQRQGDTDWQPDTSNFTTYFKPLKAGDTLVNMGWDGQSSQPARFAPYVSVQVSDLPGVLFYGLQAMITDIKNGSTVGYVWWDPNIEVQTPVRNFALLRRKHAK